MRLIRYSTITTTGLVGCLVEIHVDGEYHNVVYQWSDRYRPAAVVHYETGVLMAKLTDADKGCPQQRAQAAVTARLKGKPKGTFKKAAGLRPRINPQEYDFV